MKSQQIKVFKEAGTGPAQAGVQGSQRTQGRGHSMNKCEMERGEREQRSGLCPMKRGGTGDVLVASNSLR